MVSEELTEIPGCSSCAGAEDVFGYAGPADRIPEKTRTRATAAASTKKSEVFPIHNTTSFQAFAVSGFTFERLVCFLREPEPEWDRNRPGKDRSYPDLAEPEVIHENCSGNSPQYGLFLTST